MDESVGFLTSPFATAAAGLFGALWGSFLNVCIDRIPRGESVVRPGSHCDACGAPVRAADNIPIVSYFVLGGRCRACRAPFSARHPVVELLMALLAAGLWWKLVAADPEQVVAVRLARFALYFVFTGTLVALSFIDLATKTLPDRITLPAIPILFVAAFGAHDVSWLERAIGAAAGYIPFRLVADFYYYKLKREGLGLGDAKLLALIGAVLGWRSLPFVVFVGGFLGAAVTLPVAIWQRRRRRAAAATGAADTSDEPDAEPTSLRHVQIPFGPFLAASAILYLFAAPSLFHIWLGGE
jgi:leader peptidase (prepilin peptidase)/N-methyltransferase